MQREGGAGGGGGFRGGGLRQVFLCPGSYKKLQHPITGNMALEAILVTDPTDIDNYDIDQLIFTIMKLKHHWRHLLFVNRDLVFLPYIN